MSEIKTEWLDDICRAEEALVDLLNLLGESLDVLAADSDDEDGVTDTETLKDKSSILAENSEQFFVILDEVSTTLKKHFKTLLDLEITLPLPPYNTNVYEHQINKEIEKQKDLLNKV